MWRIPSVLLISFFLAACGDNELSPPDAGPDPADEPTPMSCRYMVYLVQDYLETYEFTVGLISGHVFQGETLGFLYFPGSEVKLAWLHLGPLIAPCSEPVVFDETCDDLQNMCTYYECTGEGASWSMHTRMLAPYDLHNWSFDAGEVHSHWVDGTEALTFTLASTATGPAGDDWSVEGSGVIDVGTYSLDLTIADPLRTGPAHLTVEAALDGSYTGSLTIGDTEVAALEPFSDHGVELIANAETCLW